MKPSSTSVPLPLGPQPALSRIGTQPVMHPNSRSTRELHLQIPLFYCLTLGHLSPSLALLAPVQAVLHVNLAENPKADPHPAQLPGDPRRHVECGCGRAGLSSGAVILNLVMG